MKRTSKWIVVLAVALMSAGQAQAVVTSADGDPNPTVGTFDNINGVPGNILDLSKTYISIGSLQLIMEADAGGQVSITEDIQNDTGIDWTDFHWELSEEFGQVTFVSVDTGGAFPNVSFMDNDTVAWADSGPGVAAGSGFTANIVLNIGNTGGGLFGLSQIPTIDAGVPEPVSAVMGMMGLAVLGYATRRRAA